MPALTILSMLWTFATSLMSTLMTTKVPLLFCAIAVWGGCELDRKYLWHPKAQAVEAKPDPKPREPIIPWRKTSSELPVFIQQEQPQPTLAEPVTKTWYTDYEAARKEHEATGKPLVVYWTIESCGPCKLLKPMVHDRIDEHHAGRVVAIVLDGYAEPKLRADYGVRFYPTLTIFKDGKLNRLVGDQIRGDWGL